MSGWKKENWKEGDRIGTEWARSFGSLVLSVSCPQGGPWLWSMDGSAYYDLCDYGVPLEVALERAEEELRKKLHEALVELGEPRREDDPIYKDFSAAKHVVAAPVDDSHVSDAVPYVLGAPSSPIPEYVAAMRAELEAYQGVADELESLSIGHQLNMESSANGGHSEDVEFYRGCLAASDSAIDRLHRIRQRHAEKPPEPPAEPEPAPKHPHTELLERLVEECKRFEKQLNGDNSWYIATFDVGIGTALKAAQDALENNQ